MVSQLATGFSCLDPGRLQPARQPTYMDSQSTPPACCMQVLPSRQHAQALQAPAHAPPNHAMVRSSLSLQLRSTALCSVCSHFCDWLAGSHCLYRSSLTCACCCADRPAAGPEQRGARVLRQLPAGLVWLLS